MDVVNRENVVIGVSVVLAVAVWYVLEAFTDLESPLTYVVMIAIGIGLPAIVLYLLPGEDYSS